MYTAQALIHVQNRDAQVIQVAGVVEELIADPATIESEIQFLTSPAFLRRMVEQLNLMDDPEFNAALREDYRPAVGAAAAEPHALHSRSTGSSPVSRRAGSRRLRRSIPPSCELNRVIGSVRQPATDRAGRRVLRDRAQLHGRGSGQGGDDRQRHGRRVSGVPGRGEVRGRASARPSGSASGSRSCAARFSRPRPRSSSTGAATTWSTPTTDNPVTLQFFQLNTQLALAQAERAGAEARLGQARSHAQLPRAGSRPRRWS